VLLIAAIAAAFQLGRDLRVSYQHSYATLAARSKMSRLEFISAYQPNAPISDVGERPPDLDLWPMEHFYRTFRAIRENYVERIEDTGVKEMAHGALRGMLQSLNDPDSRFLEANQFDVIKDQMDGKFHGIGAVLAIRRGKEGNREITKLVVVATMPGSPAEKAGVRTGDAITHLDGKWIVSYDPYTEVNKLAKLVRSNQADRSALTRAYEAAERKLKNATTAVRTLDALTADIKKDYSLTVQRPGEKFSIQINLATDDTVINPVSHRLLADGIGYLDIKLFSNGNPEEVAAALSEMAAQGATKLALDLRGCPGGLEESALKAAAEIAPGRVLGVLLKAQNKETVLKLDKPENAQSWQRIVVIVDGGTAGVAELVAAGLRDSVGAVLIGETTFGDAKHQTLVVQKDGSAVVFTDGKYLTPRRYEFDQKGVSASVKAPPTGDKEDAAIKKALEVLSSNAPAKEIANV